MEAIVNIFMYVIVGITGIVFVAFAIIAVASMLFWSYMIFSDMYLEEPENKEEPRKKSIDREKQLEALCNDLKKMSKERGI